MITIINRLKAMKQKRFTIYFRYYFGYLHKPSFDKQILMFDDLFTFVL